MMTNSTPYSKKDTLTIIENFEKGERPSLSQELEKVYTPLVPLFVSCTEVDPDLRPTSVEVRDTLVKQLKLL